MSRESFNNQIEHNLVTNSNVETCSNNVLINNNNLKMKNNKRILIIIGIALLFLIGLLSYGLVYNNDNGTYDIRIITDNSSYGWISSTEKKEYYLVNSSSGAKKKTTEFEMEKELSNQQLEQLKEIEKIDNKFVIDKYGRTSNYVFFYENFIFYTRYKGENGPHISEDDWKDMQENIYKFNIDTKQIEKIRIEINYEFEIDIKLEALMYEYPDLEQAISKKGVIKNDHHDMSGSNYSYGGVYYAKGRIFFTTYYSTSSKGSSEYLYEYIPKNKKTKEIFHYQKKNNPQASILTVDVIK